MVGHRSATDEALLSSRPAAPCAADLPAARPGGGLAGGAGANVNLPLPLGSDGAAFLAALDRLIARLEAFRPESVVVALGLDAHKDDPLAGLALETEDFTAVGQRIAALGLPTVLVQEGGYPTEHLGDNLAAFLGGFTAA
ncbi:Acetylpolyamine aminohydrolase [Halomonas sp. THAF5a]|uniref:hypothetical protein n=1 Tax=Halomonas sp. THAF5a TaxID=2587844 RepID=UPI0012A79ADF|nr:Acetylpolyamine aminohydrolase [Halomonas sp. THAF5a]